MTSQFTAADFMSEYAMQLKAHQEKNPPPPYKPPPVPKPAEQPKPKDAVSAYTEYLISSTPNKPVTDAQMFRYIDQKNIKEQKPAKPLPLTPGGAVEELNEKITRLTLLNGQPDANGGIMNFTPAIQTLETVKNGIKKAQKAAEDAYMAQPALLSESESLARNYKARVNDYDVSVSSADPYGAGGAPLSKEALQKQYDDFISSDQYILDNWDYWTALAAGARVLSYDERVQAQDAIDALYARLWRDGLNNPVPDTMDLALGSAPAAWDQETRDRQLKYLALIGALSSKASAAYAAGTGVATSLPFAAQISNAIDAARAKTITDGDEAWQRMMADSDTVSNAQTAFPGAYAGGNIAGTTLLAAAGGAGLSAAGVTSAAARELILSGALGGAYSAEGQDWSKPGQAALNTLLDAGTAVALAWAGGKAARSLDDLIKADWNGEGKPAASTELKWPETEAELFAMNGGKGYIGGTGDGLSGPVEITPPSNATSEQIAQTKAYIEGSNQVLQAGKLSPTGRVSTKGTLRDQASRAADRERSRALAAGTPYMGQVGHVPDTTWTGTAEPFSWLDLDPSVNMSIGGQANRYPIGYKPTEFRFRDRW